MRVFSEKKKKLVDLKINIKKFVTKILKNPLNNKKSHLNQKKIKEKAV